MKELLEYSALFLGVAISTHTIYMIIYSHAIRVRERRGLLEELTLKFSNLLVLASILSGKAQRFHKKYQTDDPGVLVTSTKEAREELAIIEAQTQQVLDLNPGLNLSEWARMLNKKQLEQLVAFLSGYQFYHYRLEKRFDEFRATPDMWATLSRFLSCTSVKDPNLDELFNQLLRSLGKEQHGSDTRKRTK